MMSIVITLRVQHTFWLFFDCSIHASARNFFLLIQRLDFFYFYLKLIWLIAIDYFDLQSYRLELIYQSVSLYD